MATLHEKNKQTLEDIFVRIDKKDKNFELKLARFRPEKYGLAPIEMVKDDLFSTRKEMHDKAREMELQV